MFTFTVYTNGYTSGNPTPPGVYTIPINANCQGVIETANFTVTVIADNEVSISAGSGGSVSYTYNGNSVMIQSGQNTQVQATAGTQISLTATPDAQHSFHNWITTGNVWVSDPSSATTKLNIAGDGSVTASFSSYAVTIASDNGGQVTYTSTSNSGTVNSGQQTTIQMNYGSSLSLGALPATGYGYSFESWISSSPSIVIASQSSQSTTATINGDGTITAIFQLSTLPSVALSVSSSHGSPNPSVGSHSYISGSSVTCSVSSSVTEGGVIYVCTGWTGTDSVSQLGNSASTTFTITQDSSITWNWKIQQSSVGLSISSSHGNPTPSVGSHSYTSGSSETCSVSSPATENGITYVCTGWTGTGSVSASGSGTTTTFKITHDSSLTWSWTVKQSTSSQSPTLKVLTYSVSPVTQVSFYDENNAPGSTSGYLTSGTIVNKEYSQLLQVTGVNWTEPFEIKIQVEYQNPQNPLDKISPPSLLAVSSTPQNDANNAPMMGGSYMKNVAGNSPESYLTTGSMLSNNPITLAPATSTDGITCTLSSNQQNTLLQSGIVYTLNYDCIINQWSICSQSESTWEVSISTALSAVSGGLADSKTLSSLGSLFDILRQLENQNDFIYQVTYNLQLNTKSSNINVDYSQLSGQGSSTASAPNSITVTGIAPAYKINYAIQCIQTDKALAGLNVAIDFDAIITCAVGAEEVGLPLAAAGIALTFYQYVADITLTTLANDPSLDYTQYVSQPTEPAFLSSLSNNSATNALRLVCLYYSYLNASIESNARSAGAQSQNSSYYAAAQERIAIQYANNASSIYKMMIPTFNEALSEFNASGYWTESGFEQGRSLLALQGVPQDISNILEEMNFPTNLNLSALNSVSYVPFNFNVSSFPDIGALISGDENSTLAAINAMNNQNSSQNSSGIDLRSLFIPLIAVVIIVAVLIAILVRRKSLNQHNSTSRFVINPIELMQTSKLKNRLAFGH